MCSRSIEASPSDEEAREKDAGDVGVREDGVREDGVLPSHVSVPPAVIA